MEALEVVHGDGPHRQRAGRHGLLAVRLSGFMASAQRAAAVLMVLAERVGDPRHRARCAVLAAFARAHVSRLRARLVAMGPGPLPIPAEAVRVDRDVVRALRMESLLASKESSRYEAAVEVCQQANDLASAWVCHVNRAESTDAARALAAMATALESR